jgi:hypothetical protein
MVVLGVGGVLLLATVWLGVGRLGPTPPVSAQAPPPKQRMDENALIAANAERASAPAQAAPANVIAASAEAKPAAGDAPGAAAEPEPGEIRFNPSEIQAEAQRLIEEARGEADKLEAQVEEGIEQAEE